MKLRHVSPAGSPIGVRDLTRWSGALLTRDAEGDLRRALGRHFGFSNVALTCTGRAGLTVLCEALGSLAGADRHEVIVPSYTCFSVPASIVKAGLVPRMVDVDPETLDYDYDRLERTDFRRVAAIVATNLYGSPSDLATLTRIAKTHGVFLVDDAAQAMGARLQGRFAGGWGDAGLLSFDKGKCVSAIDGGVIVLGTDAVAREVEARVARLPVTPAPETGAHMVKLAAYVVLLRPWLYWIPNGIPQLGLGETRYTTDFRIARPSHALAALAKTMLDRLPEFARRRQEHTAYLTGALQGVAGLALPRAHAGAEPAYVRLPILVRDRAMQQHVIEALGRSGIGATGSYPAALADVPALHSALVGDDRESRGGRDVASRIVTLPTHPFVSNADRQRMIEVLDGMKPALSVATAGATSR